MLSRSVWPTPPLTSTTGLYLLLSRVKLPAGVDISTTSPFRTKSCRRLLISPSGCWRHGLVYGGAQPYSGTESGPVRRRAAAKPRRSAPALLPAIQATTVHRYRRTVPSHSGRAAVAGPGGGRVARPTSTPDGGRTEGVAAYSGPRATPQQLTPANDLTVLTDYDCLSCFGKVGGCSRLPGRVFKAKYIGGTHERIRRIIHSEAYF